jgi:hypothetical protein
LISELANELPYVEAVKRLFCINELPPIQFPGSSDWIVTVNSQLGGLPAQSVFEHDHMGAANQYAVIQRSIELLNAAADGTSFARFPVTVPPREGGPLPGLAGGAGARAPSGAAPSAGPTSLRFVTPAPGAMVHSGRSVDVTMDTEPPGSLSALLLVSRGSVDFRTNGPFTFRVAIPTNAAGPQTLVAVGKDVQGALLTNEIVLVAQPAAILDSLTVFPASFQLQLPGVTEPLLVLGNYRDGVARDLTAGATGTTYTSGDPTIVSVSADGLLEPRSNGHTVITVRNGVSVQVPITVNLLPSANLAVQFDHVPTNVLTSVAADFVVRVTNAGPDAVGSVVLRQSLPAGALVAGVSAEALQWFQREGELNCHLGNVPANASVAVTVRLVFEVAGEFTTIAETSAAGFDGVPANNRAEATVAAREPARLHAAFHEGWVVLSWSTNFSGYLLESSISPGADPTWEVVATPPAVVANRLELRVSPADAARFYRLRQPQ